MGHLAEIRETKAYSFPYIGIKKYSCADAYALVCPIDIDFPAVIGGVTRVTGKYTIKILANNAEIISGSGAAFEANPYDAVTGEILEFESFKPDLYIRNKIAGTVCDYIVFIESNQVMTPI